MGTNLVGACWQSFYSLTWSNPSVSHFRTLWKNSLQFLSIQLCVVKTLVLVLVVVLPKAPLGPLRKCLCTVVLYTSPSHLHSHSPSGGRYQSGWVVFVATLIHRHHAIFIVRDRERKENVKSWSKLTKRQLIDYRIRNSILKWIYLVSRIKHGFQATNDLKYVFILFVNDIYIVNPL